MRDRNMVQRIIDEAYRRGGEHAPGTALGAALMALRGGRGPLGRAGEAAFLSDWAAWTTRYGQPDREKLERWAVGLDVEAGIAEAALRTVRPDAEEALVACFSGRPPPPLDGGNPGD
jgi:hypothetical protein